MPEIAYTIVGRNTLFMGLISHITAILVAMMPAPGAHRFFSIVFPISCLFLIVAVYMELKHVGPHPLRQWPFYVTAAATIFPLIGPLFISGMLYFFLNSENRKLTKIFGFIPALFRLRTNVLMGFALIITLFILFIFTTGGK